MLTTEIERIIGRQIGGFGDPIRPVVDAFRQNGSVIHPTSVVKLRSGDISGHDLYFSLRCGEVLGTGDIEQKSVFYETLLTDAIRLRRLQSGQKRAWSSNGITPSIASIADIDPRTVRRWMGGIRADMVSQEVHEGETPSSFLGTAERYLFDYNNLGGEGEYPFASFVDEQWNDRSMRSFYHLIYSIAPRSMSTWIPYEFEVLREHVRRQKDSGSFTYLDRAVLDAYRNSASIEALSSAIREEAGVPLDRGIADSYRDILIGHTK